MTAQSSGAGDLSALATLLGLAAEGIATTAYYQATVAIPNPTRGQALIPFVHQEQLAWYIFDLFDPKLFRFWRYQTDPEDTRRPITAREQGLTGSTRVV